MGQGVSGPGSKFSGSGSKFLGQGASFRAREQVSGPESKFLPARIYQEYITPKQRSVQPCICTRISK